MPEQDNSSEQISEWVRVHGPAVRGYVLSMVRQPEKADDIVQEVFLRAWKSWNLYDERGEARAFLMKIAYRLVCNSKRKFGREISVDDQTWEGIEPMDASDTPEQAVARTETPTVLAKVLDSLSPMEKRVLMLRYYGQMKFGDIAQLVELPLNTVLSHAHRGLNKLRQLMKEEKYYELLQ